MKTRCLNKKHPSFNNYGGRGITVCDAWKDFSAFLEDMGERPPGTTLDRINVNDNYHMENCRWADWKTQNSNKRVNPKDDEDVPF